MAWFPRSWFGSSWFSRWFGAAGDATPPDPWSEELACEVSLTVAAVEMGLGERYAPHMQLETLDPPIHLRS